ncbi:MAG: hypothetical protein EOP06_01855 [Proteobacteria bacterium]|nr:MAG: hypothetical protein EOP06_01855 [Pseudomonadota bacterium]
MAQSVTALMSLLILVLTISSCRSSSPGIEPTPEELDQTGFDLSFCSRAASLSAGRVCAIQPSSLDPTTRDVYDLAGSANDQNFGFGYHVLALPNRYKPSKGLWIHFTGTYGRPFNQSNGLFGNPEWLDEIMERGYIVLQIAYDNRFSINDTCASPPGKNRNNCSGDARGEVLTGADLTPYRTTGSADSIRHRVLKLLQSLKARPNFPLPTEIDLSNFSWKNFVVSGHSQGGNQSYFIAKYYGVKFACMLGSPYDVDDSVNPGSPIIADWLRSPGALTASSAMGQFITLEDDSYNAFSGAAAFIGLGAGINAIEARAPPYSIAPVQA